MLHTHEVTGSSPVVSTKRFLISKKSGTFLYFSNKLLFGSGFGSKLTQTLTQTLKGAERDKEDRAGRFLPGIPLPDHMA